MGKIGKRNDYPTYNEIVNTPRQPNLWQPFLANSQRSGAEAAMANAGVLVAFALLAGMMIALYSGAIWLTNVGRDALIEAMPGCVSFADLLGMGLKILATISAAWFLQMCWTCVPYVMTKLREGAGQMF